MKVKVCGMTGADNLSEVIGCSPDLVGFIFYEKSSRNVVDLEVVNQEINGCKKVGVFVNEDMDNIKNLSKTYKLDYVQLHGDESPEYCKKLKTNGNRVIKAFSVAEDFDFSQLESFVPFVNYFLFDTKGKKRGGNGTKFNWKILDLYKLNIPFFLSGGISAEDVELIKSFEHPQLYAIDINSGFEVSPGMKDSIKVRDFIHQLNNVIIREEQTK
jgi:phosphoribosylanthranilate isomerase